MRLYKQNISEEENRQTNIMGQSSNDNEDRQSFRVGMCEMKRKTSTLMAKRESYRSDIRREYLKSYFEKKRVQLFGWRPYEQVFSHNQASLEVQIDNDNTFTHFPQTSILQPAYDNNYFKGIILLQKLTSEQQSCLQDNQQSHFKYKSFYSFLISTIEQNLDRAYFQQFTNQEVFTNHFNVLKYVLYSKLAQQMEDFLLQVQQFNITAQKQNAWAYQQILLQTYEKLIWQITSFLKFQKIEFGKGGNWPEISIEEQMNVLLKMLIEVTYYDDIQCEEEEESETQKNPIYQKAYQKLSTILSFQQQTHLQISFPTRVNMTRILIQNTDLIRILKFFIVFGQLNDHQDQNSNCFRRVDEMRRRQRMICLMMVVLRNIAINVGSDELFEEGVIAELKCLLTEPYFKVQIRKHANNNNRKYSSFNINNYYPPFYYQIQKFLIQSIQMIRTQQTQQYLSQLGSFQFTFDVLQHIASIKQQKIAIGQGSYEKHQMEVQIGGEIGLFQIEKRDGVQENISEDYGDSDEKQFDGNKNLSRLMELAQSCIQCIKFHLFLGEIQSHYKQQRYHHNTTQNINIFSSLNRYIVKLNYIPSSSEVLMKFQRGQQLLKFINL